MRLDDNKSLKSYDDSVNAFIKHPLVFLPFMMGYLISILIIPLSMYFVGGIDAFNYWFNNKIFIVSPSVFSSVIMGLFVSVIISGFIIGFFDAIGLSGVAGVVNDANASLTSSWKKGLKSWLNMIVTSLTLVLVGFLLVFPVLLMITLGTSFVYYISYIIIASVFYAFLSFYPKIVTVIEHKSGLEAIKRGLKLFYGNLGFNLLNTLIIVVFYLAFSWIYVIDSMIHLIAIAGLLIPWVNIFLTVAYSRINPEVKSEHAIVFNQVSEPEVILAELDNSLANIKAKKKVSRKKVSIAKKGSRSKPKSKSKRKSRK